MFLKFKKGMQLLQTSCEISLRELVFNEIVGVHLANFLKNITRPSQVFCKEIS